MRFGERTRSGTRAATWSQRSSGGGSYERRVVGFSSTTSYTVPQGVAYVVAHIIGGGAGIGRASAGDGGSSSINFTAGTQTSVGGSGGSLNTSNGLFGGAAENSGEAGMNNYWNYWDGSEGVAKFYHGRSGQDLIVGGDVTAGQTLTITVGAGGAAGVNNGYGNPPFGVNGGSGYVWLEYSFLSNSLKIHKVQGFSSTNLSYVVPAGVTYMNAYITGGGGGFGVSAAGGTGGNSSVGFSSGTVTASGAPGFHSPNNTFAFNQNPFANLYGKGAQVTVGSGYNGGTAICRSGAFIVTGGEVTPGQTLPITIGAGGTSAEGGTGRPGYVLLEYYQ